LDRGDRIAWFNAKRFVSFQLAKILDTLQNPLRATYQTLVDDTSRRGIKGPYPLFDNVTAIVSATPVITRTATYVYACTEWVEDAFQGKEFLHQIYSRLLNPTSICLANHIVDLEAGPESAEYFAWNFNSAPVRGWHAVRDQGGKIVCQLPGRAPTQRTLPAFQQRHDLLRCTGLA
jgi:hypothetical protein